MVSLKSRVLISVVSMAVLFLCLACQFDSLPTPEENVAAPAVSGSSGEAVSGDSSAGGGASSGSAASTGVPGTVASASASGTVDNSLLYVDWNARITVSFDPWDGKFYTGSWSQNPIRVDTNPARLNEPVRPWKEGHQFVGWYEDYGTWQDKWDFSNDIATESLMLYAYFVESDTPDPDPSARSQEAGASGSVDPLYDMGLVPTPFLDLGEGQTKTLWATGVDSGAGWTDNPQYTNNCWATTSSQMLDWFFRQPGNKGFLASSTNAPKDITATRDYFYHWHGNKGNLIDSALSKYFGDFFPQFSGRHQWYRGGGNEALSLETLSALCYKHLSRGDVGGLMALMFAGQPHAMTVWGAEFDRHGLVVALYITTSECSEDENVLKPRMNRYERIDTKKAGHYGWQTSYFVDAPGASYGYTTSMTHIYGLHFLSAD